MGRGGAIRANASKKSFNLVILILLFVIFVTCIILLLFNGHTDKELFPSWQESFTKAYNEFYPNSPDSSIAILKKCDVHARTYHG